jgi:hypothetical protein
MTDGSDKSDCGWFVGISVWDYYVEFPEAIWYFWLERWRGRVEWLVKLLWYAVSGRPLSTAVQWVSS